MRNYFHFPFNSINENVLLKLSYPVITICTKLLENKVKIKNTIFQYREIQIPIFNERKTCVHAVWKFSRRIITYGVILLQKLQRIIRRGGWIKAQLSSGNSTTRKGEDWRGGGVTRAARGKSPFSVKIHKAAKLPRSSARCACLADHAVVASNP